LCLGASDPRYFVTGGACVLLDRNTAIQRTSQVLVAAPALFLRYHFKRLSRLLLVGEDLNQLLPLRANPAPVAHQAGSMLIRVDQLDRRSLAA
jgi:hypothetical protein